MVDQSNRYALEALIAKEYAQTLIGTGIKRIRRK